MSETVLSLKVLKSSHVQILLPFSCIIPGDATVPHGVSSTGSKTLKSSSSGCFSSMSFLRYRLAWYAFSCRKVGCSPSLHSKALRPQVSLSTSALFLQSFPWVHLHSREHPNLRWSQEKLVNWRFGKKNKKVDIKYRTRWKHRYPGVYKIIVDWIQ